MGITTSVVGVATGSPCAFISRTRTLPSHLADDKSTKRLDIAGMWN